MKKLIILIMIFTIRLVLGLNITETCGIDYNDDTIMCDDNENIWNCRIDCTVPNLDTILCVDKHRCIWRESWFNKDLFLILIAYTIYLAWTDSTKKRPRRLY